MENVVEKTEIIKIDIVVIMVYTNVISFVLTRWYDIRRRTKE